MMTKTFVVAALAALASAEIPAVAKREFAVKARQTDSSSTMSSAAAVGTGCEAAISSILPLYSQLPTEPAVLQTVSWGTDPCATPSLSGEAASAYTTYSEEVMSWYSSHSSEIYAALSECPSLAQMATSANLCTTALGGGSTGSASATTTTESGSSATGASGTTGSSGSSASSSGSESSGSAVATAGAARQTGLVAAAVAAAGFIGAVAAL